MVEKQLGLFGGPRQRGKVVAKGPSEFEIHCMVADYLRNGIAPGWIWHHPANGGWRTTAEAGQFKRMGVKPGVSDICLHKHPHAQLHALELKRKGEKPSEAQYAWMLDVEKIGGITAWADSVDKAIDILKEWGAVRTGFDIERNLVGSRAGGILEAD